MTLWYVPGQGVLDDSQEGVQVPEYGELTLPNGETLTWGTPGVLPLPQYTNTWQYDEAPFQWDPQHLGAGQGPSGSYNVGYIPSLIDAAESLQRGEAMPDYVREQVTTMLAAARALPMRDPSQLQAGYPGEGGDLSRYLTPASPDAGAVMLALRDKMQAGQATPQERGLYDTFLAQMREQDWRANVPQASDAFSVLGDNLFGALAILGTGATAGLAAAPLVAGGAGLASTLGSLGTLAGTAGGWAGTIGGATGQDWLQKAGLGLGALGGLAGGIGGLAHLWGTGVQSLSDAARLASSVGKIGGALGSASGSDALKQAAGYLGMAGQAGQLGSGVLPTSVTDWSTQRGGPMAWDDWGSTDWLDWSGGGQGPLLSDAAPGIDWSSFTSGGPGSWAGQMLTDYGGGGGGGGFLSTLGSLAGGVGKFLGSNSSWLGPAASALGSLGAGAIGSNAAGDAARLQAAALNRGLDLQTAQWLQQQANQAPWLAAGQAALGQLQQRAGWEPPMLRQEGPISGSHYALPAATPGWTPSTYAGYTPTDVPNAAGFRYTPQAGPRAADYRYTPGAVPTLSGQELLANDPGVQFRLDEGRKALEASAAARGGLLSGPALAALQRQGQELSSQEYGQAWNRALQQAQTREQWNQVASQMGFGQAQTEAQFREQQAALAQSQNWGQALQEAQARAQQQQFGWQAGFQGQQQGQRERQQYDTDLYTRLLQQNQLTYGRDWQEREAVNQRLADAYNAQRMNQQQGWNQWAALAGYGPQAAQQLATAGQQNATQQASLLGQLGSAQALGPLGGALNWQQALAGGVGGFTNLLKGLNA